MLFLIILSIVALLFFSYLLLHSLQSGHILSSFICLFWIVLSLVFLIASCSSQNRSRASAYSNIYSTTSSTSGNSYAAKYEQATSSPTIDEILNLEKGTVQPLAKRLPNWKLVFRPKVTITHYAVQCNSNPNCNFRLDGYTYYLKLTVYDENGKYWNSWWYKRVIGYGINGDVENINTHKSDSIDPIDCSDLPSGNWTYEWTLHTTRS